MHADRLLSLVLLLRNRGRMPASALARELEVSTRTVLRDIDALSTSGIPVFAERGRDGGFELLPGFTTDLTGLTADEAKALLGAGSAATSESLGMAPAFASAMRKVVAAMPDAHRAAAGKLAERIYVTQDGWLRDTERSEHLGLIQQAVFAGSRLRILYTSRGGAPSWRTVDPEGLVNAAGHWYLVARDRGNERTYRLDRLTETELLDEPANRPADVDLAATWRRRRSEFRAGHDPLHVELRVREEGREQLQAKAVAVQSLVPADDGWLLAHATFADVGHVGAALWTLGVPAELLGPPEVRIEIAARAQEMWERHEPS